MLKSLFFLSLDSIVIFLVQSRFVFLTGSSLHSSHDRHDQISVLLFYDIIHCHNMNADSVALKVIAIIEFSNIFIHSKFVYTYNSILVFHEIFNVVNSRIIEGIDIFLFWSRLWFRAWEKIVFVRRLSISTFVARF